MRRRRREKERQRIEFYSVTRMFLILVAYMKMKMMVVIWILCNELNGGYSKLWAQKINLVFAILLALLFGALAIIWLSFYSGLVLCLYWPTYFFFFAFSRPSLPQQQNNTFFYICSCFVRISLFLGFLFLLLSFLSHEMFVMHAF